MPILKRISGFFKSIFRPEKIIDPARHHKEHEKFYKIARDIQKEWGLKKKDAIKMTKKLLDTPRAELGDINKGIIEAWSP